MTGVVHPLIGQTASERPVTHHGDHLVALALQVTRRGHAEGRRHCRARVTGPELVVLAFAAFEKAGNSIPLTQGGEWLVAAGEQLPGVGLMPDVPDDFVAGG